MQIPQLTPPLAARTGLPLLVVGLLLLAPALTRADWTVRVSPGEYARQGTPVHVDVKTDANLDRALRGEIHLVASSGGTATPVQAEKLSPILTRLWFVVDRLAPGQDREYRIEKGEAPDHRFHWKDSSADGTKSRELLIGERPVLRYLHTPFNPENIEITKKVFHMVYSPDGSRLITKGAGGLYPHHRGIYFGYSKCRFDGKVVDTWHAHKGEHQKHEKILGEQTGPVLGSHTLAIAWNDREGKKFVQEHRTLRTYWQPDGSRLIEFRSTLRPTVEKVQLDGDRQHAGVQFRAAQEVAENQTKTRYLRPKGWHRLDPAKQINDKNHVDLPWNAIQYDVGDQGYTVAYLSDPANPEGAEFSERLYGRFGEFFRHELRKGQSLEIRYRWWIRSDRKVTREEIEQRHRDLSDPVEVTLQDS